MSFWDIKNLGLRIRIKKCVIMQTTVTNLNSALFSDWHVKKRILINTNVINSLTFGSNIDFIKHGKTRQAICTITNIKKLKTLNLLCTNSERNELLAVVLFY